MSNIATATTSTSQAILHSSGSGSANINPSICVAQFREIHKNTWLKRLTADGKKITVGPKKSERTWVVFCVHDDTDALLEGYAEPRQAGSHAPEWMVRLQDTLHISHALIPNSHEFEFVVTLSNEVMRFHAMSWEIMQEWVETLRSKLREMKILSPRENLYTKLPEMRAPLLPTRDPTSPLPAPPPVPAALVPGTELVSTNQQQPQPQSQNQQQQSVITNSQESEQRITINETNVPTSTTATTTFTTTTPTITTTTSVNASFISEQTSLNSMTTNAPLNLTAMSNTLTQNLLNMLSDPISTYSEQINEENNYNGDDDANIAHNFNDIYCVENKDNDIDAVEDSNDNLNSINDQKDMQSETNTINRNDENNERNISNDVKPRDVLLHQMNLLRSGHDNSVRLDISLDNRFSADHIKNLNGSLLIPRPQTSRSLSAGAADKNRKQKTKPLRNNVTELEICSDVDNLQSISVKHTEYNHSDNLSANTDSSNSSNSKTNITIIQVSENGENETKILQPPELPAKTITAEVFKFPESISTVNCTVNNTSKIKHHEYKSNVQVIPSNTNSSTIQVLPGNANFNGPHISTTTTTNQYSSPNKKKIPTQQQQQKQNDQSLDNATAAVTTVHLACDNTFAVNNTTPIPVYGTCYTQSSLPTTNITPLSSAVITQNTKIAASTYEETTPKLPKKIILSANTLGITNISVNNDYSIDGMNSVVSSSPNKAISNVKQITTDNIHYEKVFLSSSLTLAPTTSTSTSCIPIVSTQIQPSTIATTATESNALPITSANPTIIPSTSKLSNIKSTDSNIECNKILKNHKTNCAASTPPPTQSHQFHHQPQHHRFNQSPKMQHRRLMSPSQIQTVANQPSLPIRPRFLTRGLTEAVITTRPSRKDFHFLKLATHKTKSHSGSNTKTSSSTTTTTTTTTTSSSSTGTTNGTVAVSNSSNNNSELLSIPQHSIVNRTNSELVEHRRRSSSTSDARTSRTTVANNNEQHHQHHQQLSRNAAVLHMQQPPQPFRNVFENCANSIINQSASAGGTITPSPTSKRMTLREQQVMQLRREIMHPGGVRLQLRRKDCIGSIAWIDAFNSVWIAGWKQKECPVLYNALHIGDQLISIAGVTISNAAEANKIIRNTNTLFVEVLIRRIPFGRGYAIRRDREGQCLGLIRDGNTSTIVDVVPNSLAARHGLPPKAQSCDNASLTFWMLTEINGRPLNLFFKDNEIRDRLNSVGRDISILVQPSDLITKLKKQLKSLRSYKDYLVQ